MPDEELWQRIKTGDPDALSVLYDRYAPRVRGIALRMTRESALAEEIVQEVFTKIWMTTSYDPTRGLFHHWITTVARNVTIDALRRRMRVNDFPASETIYSDRLSRESLKAHTSEVDAYDLRSDLAHALAHLRQEDYEVVRLTYFEGFTLTEVARILSLPIGTVKTRLHRALLALRARMDDWKEGVQG